MMFGCIAKRRGTWPLSWMCEALGASQSGFYAGLTRPALEGGRKPALFSKPREEHHLGETVIGDFQALRRQFPPCQIYEALE